MQYNATVVITIHYIKLIPLVLSVLLVQDSSKHHYVKFTNCTEQYRTVQYVTYRTMPYRTVLTVQYVTYRTVQTRYMVLLFFISPHCFIIMISLL